jgi:hypothetical protein
MIAAGAVGLEGVFGFIGIGPGMDTETAIGVGMLGAVVAVRWAVVKWQRAKDAWWADWARVWQGLERDLKV